LSGVLPKGPEATGRISNDRPKGSVPQSAPARIPINADIAMYQAKARGSACHEIYDPKMHANILDRLQLEADMRGALEHKEFIVFYQPIIDLKTHQTTGFEALVRWNHPIRGLI